MGLEIERRFLVKKSILPLLTNGTEYKQGYLNTDPERTIRIRTAGEKAFLTIKGKTVNSSKLEFEYEIPQEDALQLLKLCENNLIEKTRYRIKYAQKTWEVDVFHNENDGLIIAEIELSSENENFELPPWIDKEITNDWRYYNSNLAKAPLISLAALSDAPAEPSLSRTSS